MNFDETLDLLHDATLKLTQGGSIKDRLVDAYASHLVQLDADELPEELREEFSRMNQAMQREQPLPRESVVRASVRKMSIEEAARHAAFVVNLFFVFARNGNQLSVNTSSIAASRRKQRQSMNAPIVKLFAADSSEAARFNPA